MNYRAYIYIISVLLSTFVISGINFTNFFQKDKQIQAKLFVILIILSLGFLVGKFVIEFIEVSKII